jgi:hypothetical protein
MLARGNQVRGIGCYAQPVVRKVRATFATSGTVSTPIVAESDSGITLGTMTSGALTVTFAPRPKRVTLVNGYVYESAVDRLTAVPASQYDASAGTLAVVFRADDDGVAENPADTQVYELVFITDEGSS